MMYGDIHEKIASKILYESMFLCGDFTLYVELKNALRDVEATAKIEADFDAALKSRRDSMKSLLQTEGDIEDPVGPVALLLLAGTGGIHLGPGHAVTRQGWPSSVCDRVRSDRSRSRIVCARIGLAVRPGP